MSADRPMLGRRTCFDANPYIYAFEGIETHRTRMTGSPQRGVFPSNACTPAIMSARTTATARALEAIGRLLEQPGRLALTRAEVRALGVADDACDRALRRLREEGRIRRYGSGVYGVGDAKVFQAAPEALESLGYRIVSPERPDNWSARPNGTLIRVDRRCRRRILGHGAQMKFETPGGRRMRPRKVSMTAMDAFPAQREIEAHFESFHYCHSLGRAEKDLCVTKALEALESFRHPGASLVVDGATCLSRYHGLLRRFSEDVDLRVVLAGDPAGQRAPALRTPERQQRLKEVGAAFREHVHDALPWLIPTRRGRVRRDGAVQVFIGRYEPRNPSDSVQPGIEYELVDMPPVLKLREVFRLGSRTPASAVNPLEIAAGKWAALAGRIASGGTIRRELMRHVHDLAVLHPSLLDHRNLDQLAPLLVERHEVPKKNVALLLETLRARSGFFGARYESYLDDMGTERIGEGPLDHLPWEGALHRLEQSAHAAGLLSGVGSASG